MKLDDLKKSVGRDWSDDMDDLVDRLEVAEKLAKYLSINVNRAYDMLEHHEMLVELRMLAVRHQEIVSELHDIVKWIKALVKSGSKPVNSD